LKLQPPQCSVQGVTRPEREQPKTVDAPSASTGTLGTIDLQWHGPSDPGWAEREPPAGMAGGV